MAKRPKGAKDASTASQQSEATVTVDILQAREEWSELKLSDGTKIRLKPIVASVRRFRRQYNAEGDPIYQVKSAIVFDTQVPAILKKKKRTK